jgi:hypothetical protein
MVILASNIGEFGHKAIEGRHGAPKRLSLPPAMDVEV